MKEIYPGLYQVPLTLSGFDSGSVNMYLIKTSSGLTAVDTGWDLPEAVESLQAQLAEIGAVTEDINEVILTHFHIDHLGLIPRFKRARRIKVYLHANEIEIMHIRYTGTDNFLPLTDQFLLTHGFPGEELTVPEFQLPQPGDLDSIEPDVLLQGGEELPVGDYTFRVINTPGHSPGHVAFYEAQHRFLISGDMLLPTIATNAAFHVQHIYNPLKLYIESLQALRELDFDTVLPGHEYVFNNPRKRIDELLENNARKSGVIYRTLSDGTSRTAYQISQILAVSSRTGLSHWPEMTGWEKRFAVLQTVAHLESLEYNQKVAVNTAEGIQSYRITGR